MNENLTGVLERDDNGTVVAVWGIPVEDFQHMRQVLEDLGYDKNPAISITEIVNSLGQVESLRSANDALSAQNEQLRSTNNVLKEEILEMRAKHKGYKDATETFFNQFINKNY